MKVALAGLLFALCAGCGDGGGGDRGAGGFAIYHLETAIGRPAEDGELWCGPPRVVCPGVVEQPPPRAFRYAVFQAPALTAADIDRSTVRRATDPDTGKPAVLVGFTTGGRRAFARLTKVAARVGGRDQVWHHVAVVVGEEIVAFPEIDFDTHPDGIADAPWIRIVAASEDDARELVRRLRREGD